MFATITTQVDGQAKVLDQVTYEDRMNAPRHYLVVEVPTVPWQLGQYKLLDLADSGMFNGPVFEYSDLRQAGWTRTEAIDFAGEGEVPAWA